MMELVECTVTPEKGKLVFRGRWTAAELRRIRDLAAELFLGSSEHAEVMIGQEIVQGDVVDQKGETAFILAHPAPVVLDGRIYVTAKIDGTWCKVKCGRTDKYSRPAVAFYWPRFGGVR